MKMTETWTHLEARAWVERHGGNVAACARRLGTPRTHLQAFLADPSTTTSARPLPRPIQAHMETLDELERLRSGAPDGQ